MSQRFWLAALACALSINSPLQASSADHTASLPYVESIWRIQHLQFNFHSLNNRYACAALERKVADVLRAVGARNDILVSASCLGGQFSVSAQISISLASPVPATEDNVREATTFDGRQRLAARMQNVALPTTTDIVRFPAQWERVSLTRNRQLRFSTADCELVYALNQHIFPRLAVSLDSRSFSCSTTGSRMRPRVELAALMAAPLEPLASR